MGILFLFAEFILITVISVVNLNHIARQTGMIMKDNSLSVQYAEAMLEALS